MSNRQYHTEKEGKHPCIQMGFTDKISMLRQGFTNTELIQMNRLQISLGQERKEMNTRVQR